MSNVGNATYSVLYSQSQRENTSETRLLSGLDYVAKDMKIQGEFNPEKVMRTGCSATKIATSLTTTFATTSWMLRRVGAGAIAPVKVRYKQPDATEQDPAAEVNQAPASDAVADSWSELDSDFQWAYAVASFAEILKQSSPRGQST